MGQHKIDPGRIKSPIQLLAAWFVALIILDASFLTAAGVVSSPPLVPMLLVSAAIFNVPLFLVCMFLLQTRFRAEMQSDGHYSEYIRDQEKAKCLSAKVLEESETAGLNLVDIEKDRPMTPSAVDGVRPIIEELKNTIK